VLDKVLTVARDLEAFASHAKRRTITSDDVKLVSRNNQSLKTHLEEFEAERQQVHPGGKKRGEKGRKKGKND